MVSPTVRGLSARPTPWRYATAVGIVLVPVVLGHKFLGPGPLGWVVTTAVVLLTWQGSTSDYDVTQPIPPQRRDKLVLLALALLAGLWSPVLLLWLAQYCGRLRGWKHHAMMPLRLIKAYVAWLPASMAFAPAVSRSALLLVLGCVSLSHYVKPAWSKLRLGPRPWSWAWENHTHYLMASAYCWGWARFLRAETVERLLGPVSKLNRPLNFLTLAVEAAGLIAFLDRRLLVAALAATVLFNLAVAVGSGILFWENIASNAAFAIVVSTLPSTYIPAFGWPVAAFASLVIVLSVTDLLWQPWHLAWWDTPFTARVHWEVETASGARRGIYNNFMCPYEREFGRVEGYFLTKEPVLHGHLGIVWDGTLRDRLAKADGDQGELRVLKQQYGTKQKDERLARRHATFLAAMFNRLNSGVPKGPLPRWLRCFKAPGGQLYYWGDLPPYRGEETVRRITIRYQERCYRSSTSDFALLADRVVQEIEVDPTPPTSTQGSHPCGTSSSTAEPTSESSSAASSVTFRTTPSTPSNPTRN
ncbi:hypothetical protein [Streptomyces kanamyceticus]|uniref:hypothetical protein n=1 Tax=Streptomyces kanamyceticus TaxID=1967 RepID=UPI001F0AD094|nr:hypothetical protein [Streptomyces kanamyceticus]